MKIIDEKGRLFGKLNLIDLLAVSYTHLSISYSSCFLYSGCASG